MRNLTKTLAVVSLLIPASAFPLGIGEIKLHSALNQNLDAEIALMLSPGERAADIKVNLASPDKFDETGIPWSYFLSKLKFQTIQDDNQRIVIKITSREVLKEPFLDFLLQVTWPKGDLYREFTVLVDPPNEYGQAAVPVSDAAGSYGPERRQYRSAVQKPRKQRAKVSAASSGEQYGPTAKNDTLWKIAESVGAGTGMSMEQLMVALYDANQSAFFKANVNALMAGKTLKIPKSEDILKLSKNDASDEFNRQMRAWKNPSAVPRMVAASEPEVADNQLTLSAPTEETINEKAIVAGLGQSANTGIADKDDLPLANGQKSAASLAADEAIKSKIAALEKQLAAMQELIALKDQQLAAIQNRAQPKPSAEPLVAPSLSVPPSVPQTPAPQAVQPIQPTVPLTDGALPNKQETQPKPQIPAGPVAKPPVRKVVVPAPEEDSSLWTYLGYGMAGLLLLGGGWYWQQRRKNDYEDIFESAGVASRAKPAEVAAESEQDGIPDNGGDNLFVSDLSSGEFDVFDMDQTEIDPISEADVYLAYGRYQQAEDLMRHAIDEQPDRDDFKLKLLEIFYANENKQSFEKYTTDLIDEGKIDDIAFWSKVTEMGSEICPDSMFFSVKPEPTEKRGPVSRNQEAVAEVGAEGKLDEMDFDLASFEELFYSEDSGNPADHLFDLDITTKELPTNISGQVKRQEELEQNNDSLDFDLGSLSFETPAVNLTKDESDDHSLTAPSATEKNIGLESFDFDFELSAPQTVDETLEKAKLPTPVENELSTLDFDFSSIDVDLKTEKIAETENIKFDLAEELDESFSILEFSPKNTPKPELFKEESLSINLDFNKPTLGFTEQQRIESFGVANLSEMDEMETKLDLAMAYIDMGDVEAASEIAREILEKGTAEQQMIAKALLENHL